MGILPSRATRISKVGNDTKLDLLIHPFPMGGGRGWQILPCLEINMSKQNLMTLDLLRERHTQRSASYTPAAVTKFMRVKRTFLSAVFLVGKALI